jgi:hypothetical protein
LQGNLHSVIRLFFSITFRIRLYFVNGSMSRIEPYFTPIIPQCDFGKGNDSGLEARSINEIDAKNI